MPPRLAAVARGFVTGVAGRRRIFSSLVQLKKRILRTVIKEVVVTTKADPPRVILMLHWAGETDCKVRSG
jgi:hypothetical protein